MNIIAYGGTNFINSPQITNVYLEDFASKKVTKQNLLDFLLSEIWDIRDGVILRHINNVQVDITRLSDNVLIDEITQEGYYTIKMTCEDTDNNLGTEFWQNRNVSLNTDYIKILIRENKSPAIFINDIKVFQLIDFVGNQITREDLNNRLVYKVIDDRDGIITTDILNIRIFQIGEESTSGLNGTNWFYPTYIDGSSGAGIILQHIPITEILYIDEIGEYKIQVRVQDSDGAVTVAEFIIDVFVT